MKFILYRISVPDRIRQQQTFGEWTILGQKSIRSSIKQLNWCEIHHWKIYYILKWGEREIIDKLRKSEFRHSTLSNQIQTFAVFYTTNRFLSCWFFYVVFSRVYFLFCLSNQKFIFIFYEGFRALCYSWCVRNYEHFCSFFSIMWDFGLSSTFCIPITSCSFLFESNQLEINYSFCQPVEIVLGVFFSLEKENRLFWMRAPLWSWLNSYCVGSFSISLNNGAVFGKTCHT